MWASRVFWVLTLGSAPFFLESSLEAYVLTLLSGPQMLFFRVSHGVPAPILILFSLSAVSYTLTALWGLLCIVLRRFGAIKGTISINLIKVPTIVFICHGVLLASYDWWSASGVGRVICASALVAFVVLPLGLKRRRTVPARHSRSRDPQPP